MQQNYPQKSGIDVILRNAFQYWSKTLLYQVLFSAVYFGILITVGLYFAYSLGIDKQMNAAFEELRESGLSGFENYSENLAEIKKTENYTTLSLIISGTMAFLFPLHMGLMEIYRKKDAGEDIIFSDLFSGYNGINFFRFVSYFVFWFVIYEIFKPTFILAFVWVLCTILAAPILYFSRMTFLNAVILNFKLLKVYFLEIFVCVLVAFIFKFAGLMIFIVGGLLTFPFWNAMIYALFKEIFKTQEMQSLLSDDLMDQKR